jgi:hypothetical protein
LMSTPSSMFGVLAFWMMAFVLFMTMAFQTWGVWFNRMSSKKKLYSNKQAKAF